MRQREIKMVDNRELQLKRYQIIERIGEGGMADVYLAYDKVLKRECAIKILKSDLSENPVALLRFKREADAASKLHHPSIVTIFDVGETNNRSFIVMEYVKGKTLKSLIQERGAIEKQEAVFIMTQILEGIVVAHKAGVIHRDIKPQNILIKADGTVKITDFGIATTEGAVQLTQHDSVMGSVHYMAPESARGEQATVQSDIYSLGIVFYEMLTGDVPHKGDGAVQVAIKHLKEDIRPVRDFNNSIEQSIENIVLKATAKNRQYRYQSAREMLDDVKVSLTPEHANDPKIDFGIDEDRETLIFDEVDAMELNQKNNPNDKRKRNILFGVIGASVIIIAVLLFSFFFNQPDEPNLVRIPDVSNQTIEGATSQLEALGFEVSSRITYELHAEIDEDRVIGTAPALDEEVVEGSLIRLIVSEGLFLEVVDYTGWLESDVRALFTGTKVTVRVEYESDTRDPGTVLRQELLEPGTQIDPNRAYEIKLYVSKPLSFVIPDVVGSSIESAQTILESRGGVVTLIPMNPDTLSNEEFAEVIFNTVIEVNPPAGTLYEQKEGTSIELRYWEETDRQRVDLTQLQRVIAEAEVVDTTDKTVESVEAFNQAYENATGVLNAPDNTQEIIDMAAIALRNAIDNLVIDTENPEGDL